MQTLTFKIQIDCLSFVVLQVVVLLYIVLFWFGAFIPQNSAGQTLNVDWWGFRTTGLWPPTTITVKMTFICDCYSSKHVDL